MSARLKGYKLGIADTVLLCYQIYKALLELYNEGYVTSEVFHQDSSPSKKIYTITAAGLAELKQWTMTMPESPETRNTFLIQLAWTAQLGNSEIGILLDRYEQDVKSQMVIEQEKIKAGFFSPNRTPREGVYFREQQRQYIQSL